MGRYDQQERGKVRLIQPRRSLSFDYCAAQLAVALAAAASGQTVTLVSSNREEAERLMEKATEVVRKAGQ